MNTNNQLELELSSDDAAAVMPASVPSPLPGYTITAASTPAAILAWWDTLTSLYMANTAAAEASAKSLEAEIASMRTDRSGEARRRKRALRVQCDEIRGKAIAHELVAYGMFEAALGEFSPASIAMLQAGGLAIADDDEMTVACFWDCLQRPAIEYVADMALSEIAAAYAKDAIAELSAAPQSA